MRHSWNMLICEVFGHIPIGDRKQCNGFADDFCERCGKPIFCVTVTDHDGDWSWYVVRNKPVEKHERECK